LCFYRLYQIKRAVENWQLRDFGMKMDVDVIKSYVLRMHVLKFVLDC